MPVQPSVQEGPVSLYFFNVHNGGGYLADEEGQEFADEESARSAAIAGIRSLLAAEALEGRIDLSGRLEAAGEAGQTLFTIAFAETVEVRGLAEAAAPLNVAEPTPS